MQRNIVIPLLFHYTTQNDRHRYLAECSTFSMWRCVMRATSRTPIKLPTCHSVSLRTNNAFRIQTANPRLDTKRSFLMCSATYVKVPPPYFVPEVEESPQTGSQSRASPLCRFRFSRGIYIMRKVLPCVRSSMFVE